MKVFQINIVYGIKSTGRIAADISSELKKSGFECEVAYGRGKCNAVGGYRIGNDFDVISHAIFARLFDKAGYGSAKATKRLIVHIEAVQPDIIHLHNIHGYYVNIKILFEFLAKYNKPVVWTLHDCWPFTGHCAYFDYVQCEKWKTGCYECPNKRDYPKSFFMDCSSQNYVSKQKLFLSVPNMIFVTPSRWLKKLLEQSFLNQIECRVIHNGIDLDSFQFRESDFRTRNGISEKECILLGVASTWSRRKGLADFIQLSQSTKGKYKIVLVGISEKQQKSIPSSIICINKTNDVQELAYIYSAADIFVNTSYEDNFPTVNLEALACGTPVVTYDTGGSGECLCEGVGLTVAKGDLSALEGALERIISMNVPRDVCRKRAEEYSKEKCYKEYIDLYKELSEENTM